MTILAGSVTRAQAGNATPINVASSGTNVMLVAENSSRVGFLLFNDSNQSLRLKFGDSASSTSFTVLISSNGYYEMPLPIWTGRIDGIWTLPNGFARITELT